MIGNITPITREEILWAKALGENVPDIVPVIRKEIFLAKIAGADIQTPKPITREEMYLDAIANGTELELKPITRKEMFYAKALGLTDSAPEPVTRLEQILDQVEPSGGGTGGGGEENYDKYSWEGVRAAIKNGTYKDVYKVGDLVPIDLGTYGVHNMQIVAFDADDKADGNGKAAISWVSQGYIARRRMNPTNSNAGGWEASEMRTWLQSEIYSAIPTDAKEAIVSVNKTYLDYDSGTTKTCADDVWIPSALEIFGDTSYENSGANYTRYFSSSTNRKKYHPNGNACPWWLRSAAVGIDYGERYFYHVGTNGRAATMNANTAYSAVLGFCT